jgi:hypothetical protein
MTPPETKPRAPMSLEQFNDLKKQLDDDHNRLQADWAKYKVFSPERRTIGGEILANRAAHMRLFCDYPEYVNP